MNSRIQKLKRVLKRKGQFPYLILDLVNICYLTGFKGTNGSLIVDSENIYFITDSRYEEYAQSILPHGVDFYLQEKDLVNAVKGVMKKISAGKLYIEDHGIQMSSFRNMQKRLASVELLPGGDFVNEIRMIKDTAELEIMREAVAIADDCLKHVLSLIKPGVLEWDIAIEIDYFYKKRGCRKTSFDPIVASGKNSSMPHYIVGMEQKIQSGDVLLIDMGCIYKGYNSDLTRTVFVNSIDEEFKTIHGIVRKAQETAIQAVRPGVNTGHVDSIARDIIDENGYGWAFGHSLGHGVGLVVHELPALKSKGRTKLKENMVLTVEPGIYIPGKGGIRIEDMICVTDDGCEIYTRSPKEIIVI